MSDPPPSDPGLPIEPEPPPTLDPVAVADDDLLGMAVDAVVLADLDARERMREVFGYTETLRAILDEDTWRVFLVYDERANARFAELLLVVARFAFGEGRRHPAKPSP